MQASVTDVNSVNVESASPSSNFSQPCTSCGVSLSGLFVRALGGFYHIECFKCLVSLPFTPHESSFSLTSRFRIVEMLLPQSMFQSLAPKESSTPYVKKITTEGCTTYAIPVKNSSKVLLSPHVGRSIMLIILLARSAGLSLEKMILTTSMTAESYAIIIIHSSPPPSAPDATYPSSAGLSNQKRMI